MVSYKTMLNFYMFCPWMQCWVFRETDNSFFIAADRNFTLIDVVVLKLVLYPKELSTTTYNWHVFCFSSGQRSWTLLLTYPCYHVSANEVTTSTCVFPFNFISSIVSITIACEPKIFLTYEPQAKIRSSN